MSSVALPRVRFARPKLPSWAEIRDYIMGVCLVAAFWYAVQEFFIIAPVWGYWTWLRWNEKWSVHTPLRPLPGRRERFAAGALLGTVLGWVAPHLPYAFIAFVIDMYHDNPHRGGGDDADVA